MFMIRSLRWEEKTEDVSDEVGLKKNSPRTAVILHISYVNF
jgi:hypothetical protein